ncbi:MAG: hypothetical protein H7Z14_03680 [Anaerolineae bacterium]|nr:hypothetical protein [Phycisphaerae bacterium]
MPRSVTSPDRLFDRTWRPGHPFRPKLSRLRRAIMGLALLVLCLIIGAYWYATDSNRVRGKAQDYLSRLIGGHVTIGEATLSIFQGLQLKDVCVYSDESANEDSLLFKARSFVLRVNGPALLEGRLEADQIVAIDPYVRLTEDLNTGGWNHERLRRPKSVPRTPGDRPLQLPQVVLRNAIVEYGQVQAGQRRTRGTMAIEGQLTPSLEADVYLFKLQSRGASQGIGPSVDGKVEMSTGAVSASLMNFRLGADLEAMLPMQVRQWWKDHDIAGRVDVPDLTYQPASADGSRPQTFRAPIDFRSVNLTVKPQEWLSAEEISRNEWMRTAMQAMRGAGLDTSGFVTKLQQLVDPTPITLRQVTGRFVFTESAIDIENVTGFVESNGVKISGRIENYTNPTLATTPKGIRVSSLDTDDIVIPASPRYINSMPQPVREIYDHLRPQGRCRFWVMLKRPDRDSRPEVEGEISVLDGQFTFDKFPYPIEGATGKLVFGTDPKTGAEQLEIREIRGRGPTGSANEKARVKIVGTVSPFGAESKVEITVTGDDIVSEPALFAAFPRETQKALTLFDAPGKGQFPIFRGGFKCEVLRPFGIDTEWQVTTHIRLDEAAGQLVAFPYPMSGVTGELTVTETSVKIGHATMKKNGATLSIDGQVSWTHEKGQKKDSRDSTMAAVDRTATSRMQPPKVVDGEPDHVPALRPELHIVATNVPIDADLLSAMPPDQREWLAKMGMSGRFDLDGNVTTATKAAAPAQANASDVDFDFHIKLHEGSMWPTEGMFAASNLNGSLRLTPGRVVFESLAGKRGDADLSARGSVSWGGEAPEIAITADAKNLLLDAALYGTLPESAKAAWDQVKPKGTLDAAITYSGKVEKHPTTVPTTAPATGPADNSLAAASTQPSAGFQVVLTPRKLSATPTAVPYRLDDLTGTITISPQRVVLQDVTAKHGDASVKLTGTGTSSSPDPDAPLSWDFKIAGERVPIDDELKRAMPKAMADMLKSLQLRGTVDFEFDKLIVARSSASAGLATTKPGVKADDPPLDVDFSMRMRASNASLDVGVLLTDIKEGTARFSGSTRGGNLAQLDGAIDFPTLTFAGRAASDLRATLIKPAGQDLLRIPKLEARIADGEMAGQFDCILADTGPSRYALTLVLRNADVKQFTGEAAPDVRGRLSASLALEGAFNDTASRRGRGDVSVNGERMYRIPLILGLLQITNLALPITSPFNEAAARYIVDGNRVTFESIELRAKDMLMQGSGHLDFGTKQVRLTFVTDNTTWPKLPIIGDFLQGARHELLQIYVKGTLEEPKVSAGAFGTVTTTVDEVLRGNDAGEAYRKKR